MAILQGRIVETGQYVDINVPTARIPELPELPTPIEGEDLIAIFDTSENSTRHRALSDVRNYMISGGSGTGVPPVITGRRVEIVVTDDNKASAHRVIEELLENEEYTLYRVGYGNLLSSQYEILPSGGFDILDDEVRIGDIFFADLFQPQVQSPGGGTATVSIVNGIAIISDDTILNSTHHNKSLHISATKNITVTLPDINEAPANLIIPIETTLYGNYNARILTQGGQNIYASGAGVSQIYLHRNEFLWLLRGADGWYIMKASESIFLAGQPFMDYVQRVNSVIADGSLVLRSSVPRIMALLTANPSIVVDDSVWGTGTDNKGKFSWGDGTTTIRLPDHRNRVYRALKTMSGTDPDRTVNSAGGNQEDEIKEHSHDFTHGRVGGIDTNPAGGGWGIHNEITEDGLVQPFGGSETRMKNVGLIPLIKI